MTTTATPTVRRRRILASCLALPLSLGMTGAMASTALATGSGSSDTAALRMAGDSRPAETGKPVEVGPKADEVGPQAAPAEAKPAAEVKAAVKVERSEPKAEPKNEPRAEAKAEPRAEAGAEAKAEPKSEPKSEPKAQAAAPVGATAGAASGRSAAQTATAPAHRDSSSDPAKHGTPTTGPLSKPQPLSNADKNGTGANPGTTCTHAYCSTRNGSASGNGVGDGNATGKPCAGCVGKADNKNPKGQAPNGTDHNAGYECDRNQGIGKTNPAHTGCSGTTPTSSPSPRPTGKPSVKPTPPGNNGGGGKVTVCHATGSASNPYVVIEVSENALEAHKKHGDKVLTAGQTAASCPGGSTGGGGGGKVTVCHATGSASNPYVVIEVSENALEAHKSHGDKVLTAGQTAASCPGGTPPPVCPTVMPAVGPVMAGCFTPQTPPTGGGGGTTVVPPTGTLPIGGVTPSQPVRRPVPVGPPTKVVPNDAVPPTVIGGGISTPAGNLPAVGGSAPAALPFTGTDTLLLVALGGLLLLAGGGIVVATRPEHTVRAA